MLHLVLRTNRSFQLSTLHLVYSVIRLLVSMQLPTILFIFRKELQTCCSLNEDTIDILCMMLLWSK